MADHKINRLYIARIPIVCKYDESCDEHECPFIHRGQIQGPWAMTDKGMLYAAKRCNKYNCNVTCGGAHVKDSVYAGTPLFCKYGADCVGNKCTFAHIDLSSEKHRGNMLIDRIPENYNDLFEYSRRELSKKLESRYSPESPLESSQKSKRQKIETDKDLGDTAQPIRRSIFTTNGQRTGKQYVRLPQPPPPPPPPPTDPVLPQPTDPVLPQPTDPVPPPPPSDPVLPSDHVLHDPALPQPPSLPPPSSQPPAQPLQSLPLVISFQSNIDRYYLDTTIKRYLESLMLTLDENIRIMPRDYRLNHIHEELIKVYDASTMLAYHFT